MTTPTQQRTAQATSVTAASGAVDSGPPIAVAATVVGRMVANEGIAHQRVADNLVAALLRLWRSFSGYYAGDDVARFGQQAATLVEAAQKATGQITEQHLRQQFQRMDAPLPRGTIVDLPSSLRIGADTADVYQRPARTVRYLESTGVEQADAVEQATQRLETLARTDMQLAKTTAAQQVMYAADPDTRGYRRVIHPEVSGHVCGLCIVASDRVYHRENLLPIHPGCHCTVLPIVGSKDPGHSLNGDDLSRIYEAAGSNKAADLRKTQIAIHTNGELGDVLTPAGQPPRTPKQSDADSARIAAEQRVKTLEAQRQALRKQLDKDGLTTAQTVWLSDRIDVLESQLTA